VEKTEREEKRTHHRNNMAPSTPCAPASKRIKAVAVTLSPVPFDFSLTHTRSLRPFQRNFTSGVVPTLWWMFVIITVRPVLISPNTHSRVYILCTPTSQHPIHYSAARLLQSAPQPTQQQSSRHQCLYVYVHGVHYTGTRSRGY